MITGIPWSSSKKWKLLREKFMRQLVKKNFEKKIHYVARKKPLATRRGITPKASCPALPGKVLDPNSLDCNYVYWKILAVALADESRAASHPHFSEKWVRYSKFASLFCGSAPGPGAGAAGLGGSPAPAGANNNPPSHRKVLRHPSPEKNSPMTTTHFF